MGKTKLQKQNEAIAKRAAEINRSKKTAIKEDIGEVKGCVLTPTPLSDYKRSDLMKEAKEKGIKYFRILTKAQLCIVLADGVHPDKIKAIQEEAVYKWKEGWSKKEPANVPA